MKGKLTNGGRYVSSPLGGPQGAFPLLIYIVAACFLAACSSRPSSVPSTFTEVSDSLALFPDYRDITLPPNIAPLNFMVEDAAATAFVAELQPIGGAEASASLVCGARADGKFDLDTTAWRRLLSEARGGELTVRVYARRPAGWVRYAPLAWRVAQEPIDSFLSYRLIEPGYELYRQLGIYQRNLTNFDQTAVYENNRSFSDEDNHCVNCHNYQAYDTQRMLFHVRGQHGGTVVVEGDKAHKVAIRHDSILAAGVYPSWHPTLPLVAFSTNKTGQVFHMYHREKIEVLDEASDLLLYDVEHNAVRHILRSSDHLETFPCWAPDGRRLYYCSAALPHLPEGYSQSDFVTKYDSLFYNIYSMSFDPTTRQFGAPRLEVDAASVGKSASVPRVSPDGRYLLFTLGDYGQFHIWHKSADLWVKEIQADLESDSHSSLSTLHPSLPHPLSAANSADADSYHTWSSNGRWVVFASRRVDANYSRVFIAYFDHEGRDHRAFLLPQRDPELNTLLLKSYNVPELMRSPVRISRGTLDHTVLHTDAEAASYQP